MLWVWGFKVHQVALISTTADNFIGITLPGSASGIPDSIPLAFPMNLLFE